MKRFIIAVIAVLGLTLMLGIVALGVAEDTPVTSGQCGENVYWSLDEASGTLTISGEGDMRYEQRYEYEKLGNKIYTIVVEKGVGRISDSAFSAMMQLKRAEIHAKTVGYSAFWDCRGLEEVVLDGVETVEENAFYGCRKLTRLELGNALKTVESSSFDSIAITKLVIPESMTKFNCSAFYGCSSLTEVVIPDSVTEISGRFYRCNNLKKVTLGNGVKKLGREVFGQKIQQIHIKDIDAWLSIKRELGLTDNDTEYDKENPNFYDGAKLYLNGEQVTSINVDKGTKKIEAYAFKGIVGIKSVVLPEGLESIGDQAFRGAEIRKLIIPDSVKSIGSRCFFECKKLKSVVIGAGAMSFGEKAFYSAMESLYISSDKAITALSGADVFFVNGYNNTVGIKRIAVAKGLKVSSLIADGYKFTQGMSLAAMNTRYIPWINTSKPRGRLPSEREVARLVTIRALWILREAWY